MYEREKVREGRGCVGVREGRKGMQDCERERERRREEIEREGGGRGREGRQYVFIPSQIAPDCKVIILPKSELDKANKDKKHKHYPTNFQVCLSEWSHP